MNVNAKWYRVSRKQRCQKCDHPDWCSVCPELELILCMRIESDRPSKNSMGGWIHSTSINIPYIAPAPVRKAIEDAPVDCAGMWAKWLRRTDHYFLDGFAMDLGVDTDALKALGCAWGEKAWAFPMRDENGQVIGIRLRNSQGQKWAVKGSKSGLFIPETVIGDTLFICEGPTDTAAALTLGLRAIGRPSCMGQEAMITAYIRNQKINRVVVITDNDAPGLRGSAKLRSELPVTNCLWGPPAKDLRAFVNLGGTRSAVEASVKDLMWTRPERWAA